MFERRKGVFEFKKKLFLKKFQDWKHQRRELSMYIRLEEEKGVFEEEWRHQRRELYRIAWKYTNKLYKKEKDKNFFAYFFFTKWKQQKREIMY